MKKIVCVDLDGVVADSSARFARAEEAKQQFLADMQGNVQARLDNILSNNSKPWKDQAVDVYWRTAFTPALVALDVPIAGVGDALDTLADEGYRVVYLTSRPESMRDATIVWLDEHDLLRAYKNAHRALNPARELVMKASAFQYTKTAQWKAGMVQTLASMFGAGEIIFIDEDESNREMLRSVVGLEDLTHLWCYHSLKEAVEDLEEGADDE